MPDDQQPTVPTHDKSGAPLPDLDPDSYTPALRDKIFAFVTGRSGAEATHTGDVRSSLIAAFGSSKRDSERPDTAAAAKALGVSQRSVQRWLGGGGIRPTHAKALQRQARQAMTTKRGRARAMAASRAAGTAAKPRNRTAIKVGGRQGVTSGLEHNYRPRECAVGVTDADVAAMQNAWVDGGEHGAMAWMQSHFDEHYTDQWHIRSVEDVEWGDSPVY